MAELNTEMPRWLTERVHWTQQNDSVSRDIQFGWQMAQQAQQLKLQKERLALEATSAVLENKFREVQIEANLLRNAETVMELEDARTIQQSQRLYLGGNKEVSPELRTPKGVGVWRNWKTIIDAEQADTTEWEQFLKSFSELDGLGRAAIRDAGWPIQRGQITRKHYEVLSAESARAKKEAFELKTALRPVIVDGEVKFLQSPQGGLHPVPPNWSGDVRAVEITDGEGNVLANAIPNSRGGLTVLRPQTEKRHPLQTALDKAEVELQTAKADQLRRSELPALLEKVRAYKKQIAEDEVQQPSGTPSKDPLGLFK